MSTEQVNGHVDGAEDLFDRAARATAEAASKEEPQPLTKHQVRKVWSKAEIERSTRNADTLKEGMNRYYEDQLAAHTHNVESGIEPQERADVIWLRSFAWQAINIYEMITSFVVYHLLGRVSRETFKNRASFCERCTFRYRRHSATRSKELVQIGTPVDWRDKCYGPGKGKPCGCPSDLAWKPSSLRWKLWLRLFRCPCGHFDRGDYSPKIHPDAKELNLSGSSGCHTCKK